MADPNNIPQQADQRELNSEDNNAATADIDFDKEFEIAKANENGAGSQSSDPNPVNRQGASDSVSDNQSDSSAETPDGVSANSGGPSDPDSYREMAREVTSNAE
ncbi:MAG: hypothetical protein AAFS04_08385 [Cyanobacteria bacterium J06631_9]